MKLKFDSWGIGLPIGFAIAVWAVSTCAIKQNNNALEKYKIDHGIKTKTVEELGK